MKRRDVSLTVGLCVSFAAHVFLLRAMADRYSRERIYLSAPTGPRAALSEPNALMIPVPADRRMLLGDDQAKISGDATDTAPGETALEAKEISPLPQPMLQRDTPGENGIQQAPPPRTQSPTERPVKSETARPSASGSASPSLTKPPAGQGVEQTPEPAGGLSPQPSARPPSAPSTPSDSPPEQTSRGAAPGKPIPQGSSDSDAFTSIGSVDFRGGAINARIGRRHRITRPRIALGGMVDAVSIGRVVVTLQLKIDQQGNVVNVQIAESSGSANIDEATKLAAYEWWFDPKKAAGANGQEQTLASESFRFTVGFR